MGGSTPPSGVTSFKGSAGKFVSPGGSGFGLRLPEGEYEVLPPLQEGYLPKSMSLNGTEISGNRVELKAHEDDYRLVIILTIN